MSRETYSGRAGARGGRILDSTEDNAISFEWTGSTLQFSSEDVNVKSFIIDHPVDPSRYLVHMTLEGPENAVFYRGTARLQRGVAEVVSPQLLLGGRRERRENNTTYSEVR